MSTAPSARARRRIIVAASAIIVLAVVIAAVVVGPRLGSRASTAAATAMCVAPAATLPHSTGDVKSGFIYQVLLDRFFDGDISNDNPPGDTGLNDPTHQNWKLYWGGDLKGLAEKIPYIAGMGATAIWISPPVQNTTTPLDFGDGNGPQAGYHGYWATDDYRIDPHLGTWADFDTLIATAHQAGVQVIVDFAANHSNPETLGQFGAIYKNGVPQATYTTDPNGWFHHGPGITNFNDSYDLQYDTLEGLADFAQENPAVDAYLKGAIAQFVAHGVDGFRLDAVKHMPGGWLRTVADGVEAQGPRYLVGEWQTTDTTDLTYPAAVRFANTSGIALLNFPVYTALNDAFGNGSLSGPVEIDSTLQTEAKDFTWPNDQANFIDNHDVARFLTVTNSRDALHAALAVVMTIPGIPIIYYGTEQYLHNDTNGGGDPYNRPMMPGFDTTTPAYQLLHCLGALRASNPALAYGTYSVLHISRSYYVFQRQFGQNVVIVAVNAGADAAQMRAGAVALPAGSHADYLHGAFHGGTLVVGSDGTTQPLTLPGHSIAVWQYSAPAPTTPQIGSSTTELTRPGDTLTLDGQGFAAGDTIMLGTHAATVRATTATSITTTVPTMPGGLYQARVCAGTVCSAGYPLDVATAAQIPVTITAQGLPTLTPEDHLYITGALAELGGGDPAPSAALGPMLAAPTATASRFLLVSLPACQQAALTFEIVNLNGTTTRDTATHTFAVPCQGESSVSFTWNKS
jgi:glycosidase